MCKFFARGAHKDLSDIYSKGSLDRSKISNNQ